MGRRHKQQFGYCFQSSKNVSNVDTQTRAESDLSSANHSSQIVIVDYASRSGGVGVRYENTGDGDYYLGRGRQTTSDLFHIFKRVTSFTELANGSGTPADGETLKLTVDGSDLDLLQDAVSRVMVTDTSITGHVRVGMRLGSDIGNGGGGNGAIADNFEAADVGAVGAGLITGLRLNRLSLVI